MLGDLNTNKPSAKISTQVRQTEPDTGLIEGSVPFSSQYSDPGHMSLSQSSLLRKAGHDSDVKNVAHRDRWSNTGSPAFETERSRLSLRPFSSVNLPSTSHTNLDTSGTYSGNLTSQKSKQSKPSTSPVSAQGIENLNLPSLSFTRSPSKLSLKGKRRTVTGSGSGVSKSSSASWRSTSSESPRLSLDPSQMKIKIEDKPSKKRKSFKDGEFLQCSFGNVKVVRFVQRMFLNCTSLSKYC